jgi:hypothetical protein
VPSYTFATYICALILLFSKQNREFYQDKKAGALAAGRVMIGKLFLLQKIQKSICSCRSSLNQKFPDGV